MEVSHFLIQVLVEDIKREMFSNNIDPYTFVSPSAYDTAWLAMIPDPSEPGRPMFKTCLDWVLNNQREEGYWGECDSHGRATVESLSATLACTIVLRKWNSGNILVQKGLAFFDANMEKLLRCTHDCCPRWFAIVFPAMLELATSVGLDIIIPKKLKGVMIDIFFQRQQILETEELVDKYHYPPLLSYLEVLPSSYDVSQEDILRYMSSDGSLFHSPSATAAAFMATGSGNYLAYLQYVVQRCDNGVPSTYPMDDDLIKLCIVNQLQRLGLAEHFITEIEDVLSDLYLNYMNQEPSPKSIDLDLVGRQLYKDSLAFRLLRMHGFGVSPLTFCWFLHNQEIQEYIENDPEYFSSVMLSVYKATNLMFPGEHELQEAKSFSSKSLAETRGQDDSSFPFFHKMIEHELELPWLSRMNHLEHRSWIEENHVNALWMGKTSFQRLSCIHNDKLIQLATKNYEFRQSIYKNELEELKRWSKDTGLSEMGFGREKTTYCYFAVASCMSLPYDSDIRLIVAKSGILITIADDFFDMAGSLNELKIITNAVKRWDANGLNSHSKTIFDALQNLVKEVAEIHLQQRDNDITSDLQNIWYETFASWLVEAKWTKSGSIPTMDEYLQTGMTSIASQTIVLTASCLLNPSLPTYKLRSSEFELVTTLLMMMTRLLNDIQSYKKEEKDGKTNFVSLYMKENSDAKIEDSIAHAREIVARKEKEFLKHILMDGFSDLTKRCKELHLSCFKVFHMFFNITNHYDSNTEMLQDIQRAIYVPLTGRTKKPSKPLLLNSPHFSSKKEKQTIINYHIGRSLKYYRKRNLTALWNLCPISKDIGYKNMIVFSPKFRFCFI